MPARQFGTDMTLYRQAAAGAPREEIARVAPSHQPTPSWIHDFPVTPNWAVIPETPICYNLKVPPSLWSTRSSVLKDVLGVPDAYLSRVRLLNLLQAAMAIALMLGELSGSLRRQAAVVGGAEYVMFDWIPERGTRLHLVPLAPLYSYIIASYCAMVMEVHIDIYTDAHI